MIKTLLTIAVTLVVLVFYGHFLHDIADAGYYWLFPILIGLTFYAGYLLSTPAERRLYHRTWRRWGRRFTQK